MRIADTFFLLQTLRENTRCSCLLLRSISHRAYRFHDVIEWKSIRVVLDCAIAMSTSLKKLMQTPCTMSIDIIIIKEDY